MAAGEPSIQEIRLRIGWRGAVGIPDRGCANGHATADRNRAPAHSLRRLAKQARTQSIAAEGRFPGLPNRRNPCYVWAMNRTDALDVLKRSEPALRARGVRRAAIFGSVARGDHRPNSDIDIMVEIDPEAHITVFDYVDLKDFIASLFDGPVDVVNREGLKPYVRPAATADALYAF
jgi:predicted nucleotidyltransferase